MKKLLALAVVLACAPAAVHALTFNITYTDSAGEGFNDTTAVGSTTRGALRKQAFEYCLNYWGARLSGTVPVEVEASFDPLPGNASSAVLAAAGPGQVYANFTGAPVTNTWYPAALAHQLFGLRLGAGPDVVAQFNSDVDGPVVLGATSFYYGLDETPPGNDISLVRTALHELGHGLGFVSLLSRDANGFPTDGSFIQFPSVFDRNMNIGPPPGGINFANATNPQRFNAVVGDNLYWSGPAVITANNNTSPQMYAPSTFEPGSSVAHFDEGAATFGGFEELMEPALNTDLIRLTLTDDAMNDMGYVLLGPTELPDALFPTSQPASANEGSGPQVFTVTLNGPQTEPVTVDLAFSGTATAGQDYLPSASTLVFAPGDVAESFTITPLPDAASESPETVLVKLFGIRAAEFGTPSSTLFSITNFTRVEGWHLVE